MIASEYQVIGMNFSTFKNETQEIVDKYEKIKQNEVYPNCKDSTVLHALDRKRFDCVSNLKLLNCLKHTSSPQHLLWILHITKY